MSVCLSVCPGFILLTGLLLFQVTEHKNSRVSGCCFQAPLKPQIWFFFFFFFFFLSNLDFALDPPPAQKHMHKSHTTPSPWRSFLHILLPTLYVFICHPVYILSPLIERISSTLFCRSKVHYEPLLYMNQWTHGVMESFIMEQYHIFQLWSKWALLGHFVWRTLSYVVCKWFENVLFAHSHCCQLTLGLTGDSTAVIFAMYLQTYLGEIDIWSAYFNTGYWLFTKTLQM